MAHQIIVYFVPRGNLYKSSRRLAPRSGSSFCSHHLTIKNCPCRRKWLYSSISHHSLLQKDNSEQNGPCLLILIGELNTHLQVIQKSTKFLRKIVLSSEHRKASRSCSGTEGDPGMFSSVFRAAPSAHLWFAVGHYLCCVNAFNLSVIIRPRAESNRALEQTSGTYAELILHSCALMSFNAPCYTSSLLCFWIPYEFSDLLAMGVQDTYYAYQGQILLFYKMSWNWRASLFYIISLIILRSTNLEKT